MKSLLYFTIAICITAMRVPAQNTLSEYYVRWHQHLDNHPSFTEPSFFDTEHAPKEYLEIISPMLQNNLLMSDYLCEIIAHGNSRNLYRDVLLLSRLSGINLYFSDENQSFNGHIAMKKLVPQFQKEWRDGIYKKPDALIKVICDKLMLDENNKVINPRSLLPIRRYGIFGIPELIRQIRSTNSKHAFAAFLVITHQKEYSEFINRSEEQYVGKSRKMDAIIKWSNKEANKLDNSNGVMKRIMAEAHD